MHSSGRSRRSRTSVSGGMGGGRVPAGTGRGQLPLRLGRPSRSRGLVPRSPVAPVVAPWSPRPRGSPSRARAGWGPVPPQRPFAGGRGDFGRRPPPPRAAFCACIAQPGLEPTRASPRGALGWGAPAGPWGLPLPGLRSVHPPVAQPSTCSTVTFSQFCVAVRYFRKRISRLETPHV